MKIAIMQPYFLPYIGYFQLINAVEKFVIYDDVNFIKKGWINRNNILLGGKSFLFTLSLLEVSQNKLINEIYVSPEHSKLLKTIETTYRKAPYFSTIIPIIEDVFNYEDRNLARYVGNSLIKIANYLELDTEFIYSSEIKEKDNLLKAQDKILNICTTLSCTQYINAIGGMELYSKERFADCNIKLSFLKTLPIEYKQFNNTFVPWLSMLDVLMFNSVEEINNILKQYELV